MEEEVKLDKENEKLKVIWFKAFLELVNDPFMELILRRTRMELCVLTNPLIITFFFENESDYKKMSKAWIMQKMIWCARELIVFEEAEIKLIYDINGKNKG